MSLSKYLDPKNDVAFKKIFGTEKNKDILIHFINDVLEMRGLNEIQSVEFLSPVQDPEIAYQKQSIVDVLCKDASGVQYIIEMQISPSKGFEKRAQYYAAKAYGRQAARGSDGMGLYCNLKKIIFIAILDCVLFPEKESYKSDHIILDKVTYENDLKDFSFTFIELPKFKKKPGDKLDNILQKWCYFFKYADQTSESDLQKIIESDLIIKRAYEALDQFGWSEQELLSYEEQQKRILDHQSMLDAALDKGMNIGLEKGIAEGLEKGKVEGKLKEKKALAMRLLAKNTDIQFISEVTELSEAEILKLVCAANS
ncbi:Rpn family recombination-promoting nuclease/putative transposase [Candidatus Lariskella endosymbiont of Epinotia ramella]|uniref:Rpn family recombination-promoting nuclease/putative transposase n=1 Tax=Candidatus Lariskella endosymbiont of Epinotia ramella TaxID=3066224 RepID=UPI0030D6037F